MLRVGEKNINLPTLVFAFVLSYAPVMILVPNEYLYLLLFGIRLLLYGLMVVNIALSHQRKVAFFGCVFIAFWIMLTILIYPMNAPALKEIAPDMFMQIFFFLLGNSCMNDKSVIKTCTVFAYIELVALVLIIFSQAGKAYNLTENYDIISNGFFWICLFFTFSPKENNRFSKVSAFVVFMLMLVYGRRSHILYYAITVCLYSLRKIIKDEKKNMQKVVSRILIFGIIVIIGLLYKQILLLISDFILSLGINSRTIMMILSGEFGNLNGRDELYQLAWQMTLERPYIGNGIGSTMVRWMMLHPNTPNYAGCNTHNSLLEVGAEFGFPGMFIFVIIALKMIRNSMNFDISDEEETILFTLFGTGFISVLIGASYLRSSNFALFCGYYLYLRKREKSIERPPDYYVKELT